MIIEPMGRVWAFVGEEIHQDFPPLLFVVGTFLQIGVSQLQH